MPLIRSLAARPWSGGMDTDHAGASKVFGVTVASIVGTTMAWYDYFLYFGAAVFVFNHLFFPPGVPLAGSLVAVAAFGVGVAARPLGAIVFGHLGDRYGRRTALVAALLVTGGAAGLVAVLPTYRQVGLVAPILLVALRLVQGLGIGGVWPAAVVMALEHARPSRRGLMASWPQVGVVTGSVLALGLLTGGHAALSARDFFSWGWRVPFLVSAALVVVCYWVRSRLVETPPFAEAAEAGAVARRPLVELFHSHRRGLIVATGVAFGAEVAFAAFSFGYVAPRLVGAGLPLAGLLVVVPVGLALFVGLIPLFGALSDRLGRRPVSLAGAVVVAVWVAAFFPLLQAGSPWGLGLGFLVGLVGFAALYGPQAALLGELFPTRLRVSGAGVSYQMAGVLTGPLGAILASTAMPAWSGNPYVLAGYVLLALGVTITALACAPETADRTATARRPRAGA